MFFNILIFIYVYVFEPSRILHLFLGKIPPKAPIKCPKHRHYTAFDTKSAPDPLKQHQPERLCRSVFRGSWWRVRHHCFILLTFIPPHSTASVCGFQGKYLFFHLTIFSHSTYLQLYFHLCITPFAEIDFKRSNLTVTALPL